MTLDLSFINDAWECRATRDAAAEPELRAQVERVIAQLGEGTLRVAEKRDGNWCVNEDVKKAILLYFRLRPNALMPGGPCGAPWWDKVPPKFATADGDVFRAGQFRVVPEAYVRAGAYLGPQVVVMPSFINIGAHVGEGTMIDSYVTVGSGAQIGKHCHISSAAMIGGVLEPLQAAPVIVEDNCFIGAHVGIAEGVIVGEGAVLGMGVQINAATKLVDRASGAISYGTVPPYAVVVPGSLPDASGLALACAVIVKCVDAKTRVKTSINELLRV